MIRIITHLLTFLMGSQVLSAGEIRQLDVIRKDNTYHLEATMYLDASADKVTKKLTDYENLKDLSPIILQSEVLDQAGASTRVQLDIKACILIFCKNLRKTENLSYEEPGTIKASMIPELSDFRNGEAIWRVRPAKDGALLEHKASLEPDFWVPPLIGPFLIKRTLRKEVMVTLQELEKT